MLGDNSTASLPVSPWVATNDCSSASCGVKKASHSANFSSANAADTNPESGGTSAVPVAVVLAVS
eukprot:10976511-Karenia_brevis.AAC.1